MSLSHHSGEEEAASRRLLNQMFKKAKEEFPEGRLNRADEGELAFAVAADHEQKAVLIHFGKPVVWCGMNAKQARMLAGLLTEKANELEPA